MTMVMIISIPFVSDGDNEDDENDEDDRDECVTL